MKLYRTTAAFLIAAAPISAAHAKWVSVDDSKNRVQIGLERIEMDGRAIKVFAKYQKTNGGEFRGQPVRQRNAKRTAPVPITGKEMINSLSIWHLAAILILCVFALPIIIGLTIMGLQRTVWIKHHQSGLVKKGYVGYCWTYFFFGWLVPVFRGEIAIGFLHLILTSFTLGFFQIIMPFLYNKQFMTRQLTSGWKLSDDEFVMAVARLKLGIAHSVGNRDSHRIEPTLSGN